MLEGSAKGININRIARQENPARSTHHFGWIPRSIHDAAPNPGFHQRSQSNSQWTTSASDADAMKAVAARILCKGKGTATRKVSMRPMPGCRSICEDYSQLPFCFLLRLLSPFSPPVYVQERPKACLPTAAHSLGYLLIQPLSYDARRIHV